MDSAISAEEAESNFPRLLREVRDGRSYVVTVRGMPVARIIPCTEPDARRAEARAAPRRRLEVQEVTDFGRWIRDEIYER